MKYPLIIFLYITLFKKNKLQDCEYFLGKLDLTEYFEEFCNIQIPNIESDCTMLAKNRTFQNITCTINNTVQSKACCFERFRINKVITTRCSYIDKTEDGIREEKRLLRDSWDVKNLTILSISENQYLEWCNIQNPTQESDCTNLKYLNDDNPTSTKACCFERFRINKVVTTRCTYIDKTEKSIKDEKKFLRNTWGVKNLTVLCYGENLKFNSFLLFFEIFIIILV